MSEAMDAWRDKFLRFLGGWTYSPHQMWKARAGPMDCGMSNQHAWVLGTISQKAAADKNVGDYIDRGLILRRMLEEEGYALVYIGDQER